MFRFGMIRMGSIHILRCGIFPITGGFHRRLAVTRRLHGLHRLDRLYRFHGLHRLYGLHRLHGLHGLYRLHRLYRLYGLYRLHRLYRLHGLYRLHRLYRLYGLHGLYRLHRLYRRYCRLNSLMHNGVITTLSLKDIGVGQRLRSRSQSGVSRSRRRNVIAFVFRGEDTFGDAVPQNFDFAFTEELGGRRSQFHTGRKIKGGKRRLFINVTQFRFCNDFQFTTPPSYTLKNAVIRLQSHEAIWQSLRPRL